VLYIVNIWILIYTIEGFLDVLQLTDAVAIVLDNILGSESLVTTDDNTLHCF